MVRSVVIGTFMAGLCFGLAGNAVADDRVSASKKGSLLFYSKVELQYELINEAFVLTRDTFIDIANDYTDDVWVQLYYINGDPPTPRITVGDPPVVVERAHPGWNNVDCQMRLTANQPAYFAASTGLPGPAAPGTGGCQPFTILDPGFPPGRPNPDFASLARRTLRGYIVGWAVNVHGEEIRWNHLKGDAVIIDYDGGTAWEYNAYAFAAISANHGAQSDGQPGLLLMDGVEYDYGFDKLVLDFFASGSLALSGILGVVVDTDLTLHPITADLRQDTLGPICTKAHFDIWNEMEARFSGTTKCICCWDQTLLSNYPAENHFLLPNLHTNKGKARIDGVASTECDFFTVNASLLGLAAKQLTFFNAATVTGLAEAGMTLVGQGAESGAIAYDIIEPSDELTNGGLDVSTPSVGDVKPAVRTPR